MSQLIISLIKWFGHIYDHKMSLVDTLPCYLQYPSWLFLIERV